MEDKKLLEAALAAADNAYAPYSGFRVGAVVLLEDGTVISGNNQENMAYPLGSCAERVAVNYARANYPQLKITALAVASPDSEIPVTPCGGCREVLREASKAQGGVPIRLIFGGKHADGDRILSDTESILPDPFAC